MRVQAIPPHTLLAYALVATGVALQQTVSASTVQHQTPPPPKPQHQAIAPPHHASFPSHLAAAGGVFLEKLTSLFDVVLPADVDGSGVLDGDGGLFGDEGSSLAWGGSTLEVVKTQASYLTRPAAFGPRIVDDNGLRGNLLPISDFYRGTEKKEQASYNHDAALAVDNYGCPYKGGPGWNNEDEQDSKRDKFPGERFDDPRTSKKRPPRDWIALIERGGECSFVAKVRVAQALGAQAVVVGDAPSSLHDGKDRDPGLSGRLVTMFAPGDTSDVKIPSTFVTRPSYVDLIRLVDEAVDEDRQNCAARKKQGKTCSTHKRGVEVVLWRDDAMWEWPLIDLAFILLMLPSFMTLVTIIVHRIRLIRQRRKDRAPETAVSNLPCLIWRGNGQPWEKVEDVTAIDGAGGELAKSGGDAGNHPGWRRSYEQVGAWIGRMKRRSSIDMETGTVENGEGAVQLSTPDAVESAANEAGPSRPAVQLKTVPFAPPVPPTDRTYFSFDECAICLSDFVDGDMVRVLPCGHVFHLPEIDSWLLKVKKFCPICKRDMTNNTPKAAADPARGESSSAAPTPSGTAPPDDEHAPLLIEHDCD